MSKQQEIHQTETPVLEQKKGQVSLDKSLEKLARYGGYDLLETSIENVQNINPDRKARRKIFLTEKGKEKERETLKKTLELWASVISKSDSLNRYVAHCEDQKKICGRLIIQESFKSGRCDQENWKPITERLRCSTKILNLIK